MTAPRVPLARTRPCHRERRLARPTGAALMLALASALLIGPMGCGSDSEPPPSGATGSGAQRTAAPAEVRLGYFANLTHAQAVLGVSSGELARAVAPSTLVTRLFNAGPSLIEALFAGEVDIGYIGPGPALNGFAKSRGQGLRIIAGAAANGVAIVARPGAGIATLADLKGKRIATPQLGNTQDISARHYLVAELGQPDADNVIPVPNAEQASMMANGEIDAAWAPEPWGALLVMKSGAVLLAEEKDLWPGKEFTLAVVITTPQFLAAHPDLVRNVLRVHRGWTDRLNRDSATYLPRLGDALNALTGKGLPPEVFATAFARTRFTDEPLESTLAAMAAWSYDLGFAKERPDLTGLVDTTILRELEHAAPTAANHATTPGGGVDAAPATAG